MSEELRRIKREIASTRMKLHDDAITEEERIELNKKEELLQIELKESRINQLFDRMEERNNEKHKRR
jgi:hypothetical protein